MAIKHKEDVALNFPVIVIWFVFSLHQNNGANFFWLIISYHHDFHKEYTKIWQKIKEGSLFNIFLPTWKRFLLVLKSPCSSYINLNVFIPQIFFIFRKAF